MGRKVRVGCKCLVSLSRINFIVYSCLTLSRLNAVTTRFSNKLRRLSATDNLVKTAGVAGYAQAVLVPELAVLLVKEDMNVSDEEARQILRESIDIGEKLNAAPNDVVPIPPEEEDAAGDQAGTSA